MEGLRTLRTLAGGIFASALGPQKKLTLKNGDHWIELDSSGVEMALEVIAELHLTSDSQGRFLKLCIREPGLTEASFSDVIIQIQGQRAVLRAARWDRFQRTVVVILEYDGRVREMTTAEVYRLMNLE